MNEELLISLVQRYKELYDISDSRYHDEQRRMNIWKEISEIIKETPAACKEKWKKIRDNYRRAKNLRKIKSGQSATIMKPIRYEKDLEFLNSFINNESDERLVNLPLFDSEDERINEKSITSPPSTPESNHSTTKKKKRNTPTPQLSTPTHNLFQSYLEQKYQHDTSSQQEDTVVNFFKNLGQTVKTFPPDMQVRVKGAVFKIINDAEAELVRRNTSVSQVKPPL